MGFDKEKIRASFVAVNNQLVHNRGLKVDPGDILILAPHCLQWSQCPHKITVDVNNCRRCGRCPISDLHRLAETYGVRFAVATGGTLARSFVKKAPSSSHSGRGLREGFDQRNSRCQSPASDGGLEYPAKRPLP
ncbi:MAG: DUF116 domain-containing protein [Bacillota bacterium]